jgi:hypothetical protein
VSILAKKELMGKTVRRCVDVKMAASVPTLTEFATACLAGLVIIVKLLAPTQLGGITVKTSANVSTTQNAESLMAFVFASQDSWGRSVKKYAQKGFMAQTVSRFATATASQTSFAIHHMDVSVSRASKETIVTSRSSVSSHRKKKVSFGLLLSLT